MSGRETALFSGACRRGGQHRASAHAWPSRAGAGACGGAAADHYAAGGFAPDSCAATVQVHSWRQNPLRPSTADLPAAQPRLCGHHAGVKDATALEDKRALPGQRVCAWRLHPTAAVASIEDAGKSWPGWR